MGHAFRLIFGFIHFLDKQIEARFGFPANGSWWRKRRRRRRTSKGERSLIKCACLPEPDSHWTPSENCSSAAASFEAQTGDNANTMMNVFITTG